MDPFLDTLITSPVELEDLLQPEFLFDVSQLADDHEDAPPSAIQPSGSPPTNDHLLTPPPPTGASIALSLDVRPQISPAPPILAPIPLPASKASAKNKPAARKRGRSTAAPSASTNQPHTILDDNDDNEENNDQQEDRDRARLRTNESKYRQGLQQLFDSLGKALGKPGLGKPILTDRSKIQKTDGDSLSKVVRSCSRRQSRGFSRLTHR